MTEIVTDGIAYETPKGVLIRTVRPSVPNLSDEVRVFWRDSRMITNEQRRKAWALMTEIATAQGETKDEVYREQTLEFSNKNIESLQGRLFHLSDATVTEARSFITLLIEIILEYGIPTKEPLYGLCDDLERYTYACLMSKRCAVCGRKPDLHHVDSVGMGFDRREIDHIGMRCLPLCREHHQECHSIGQSEFDAKYHLIPIQIDAKIANKYKLKGASG